MTQAYQARTAVSETVSLAFKRHILESSSGFASEPMADAFRVNLLSQMLDRCDALQEAGMSEETAMYRTIAEFNHIAGQMRTMGFEEAGDDAAGARWSLLDADEAQRYMAERDAYMHRIALGVFMCVACVTPIMLFMALCMFTGLPEVLFAMFGVIGMFAMIGMGVYAMVSAGKPKDDKKIKEGRFSLGRTLRRRLTQMKETVWEKARKRQGRGVAAIVTSIIPVFVGAMMDGLWFSQAWPLLGTGVMFVMIAAGVYELVMADGEKKTMKRLFHEDNE